MYGNPFPDSRPAYLDTPLWDSRLPLRKRIEWLLGEMTIDEKLSFLSTSTPALERFGIGVNHIGGEAAHGVEARHDQDGRGVPETTTSFPQPIGMSASWDEKLIREAGRVVGKEARILYNRHPEGGLFRWAPTVDMERDPRWGRTEEGYGEEPFLTGKMASSYVQGMQGDDPEHLLISSALKHFFANNVENGRGVKSSSIGARLRREYYYEPFRRVIEEGGATSVMTAYNKVNGVVQMLDHRVSDLIRGEWGLEGHVVCDGGAMSMACDMHHATKSHAETVARSLKAGVDCMTDRPETVKAAAREAYEKGWITEKEIDRALTHCFETKLRLGLYDAYGRNPWSRVPEEDLNSEGHRAVSLTLARESLVLLKNDGLLPLAADQKISVIGPLADTWYQDWYGGEPYSRTTVLGGVREVLTGCRSGAAAESSAVQADPVTGISALQAQDTAVRENLAAPSFADGLDRVYLKCGGRYVGVDEERRLFVTEDRGKAEKMVVQDWGNGRFTFYVPRLGCYLEVGDDGQIRADKKDIFSWFVKECFIWTKEGLQTWYHSVLCVRADGHITAEKTVSETPVGVPQGDGLQEQEGRAGVRGEFELEVLESGTEQAVRCAAEADAVILVLGCCPMINGKEDADRPSIEFPASQRALAKAVLAANPHTVLALISNYPYAIDWEQEHIPAILWSASGSQDLGTAVAETIFGLNAPAGRLNMTWYPENEMLPDMDDYDIAKTGRTLWYYRGKPLYAFGHGLTYSPFRYGDFAVFSSGARRETHLELWAVLTIENLGSVTSDEVVQLYVREPAADAPKAIRRLVAFERIHDVAPGEKRGVMLRIPYSGLQYYDVVSGTFLVEEGRYLFEAGAASDDIRVQESVFVPGGHRGLRAPGSRVSADHWDDYENIELDLGPSGGTAADECSARLRDPAQPGQVVYRSCPQVLDGGILKLNLAAPTGGSLSVLLNGIPAASWTGTAEEFQEVALRCAPEAPREKTAVEFQEKVLHEAPGSKTAEEFQKADLHCLPGNGQKAEAASVTLAFRLTGDVRLASFCMPQRA